MHFDYRIADENELEIIWDRNIANSPSDDRWVIWKKYALAENRSGEVKTFAVFADSDPIGEATLVFSPNARAVGGRLSLADGANIANLNALRMRARYEGKGHMSTLVKAMEKHAKSLGYSYISIGVELKETRNIGIYLHWGYDTFIETEGEGEDTVVYYSKKI